MRILAFRRILGVLALAAAGAASAQPADCDRDCLERMLGRYLDAVVANDPSGAPLFVGFRQTENSVVVPLGEGVWSSVTSLGPVQRHYYDPVSGNAAFFGVLEEGAQRAVASVRLRVERNQITEAEWHIGRAGGAGIDGTPGDVLFDVDHFIENPPEQRVVPRRDRVSREALIAIANSYFDGITNRNADIIKAHGGCFRLENGFDVTGRPLPPERADDGYDGRSDCTSGQGSFDVAIVAARRFPVVDVDAQTVLASAVFVRTPRAPKWRNHFAELFYIDDARIRGVYAAMFYADPSLAVPNWPPYDGNFALAAPAP